MRLFKKNTNKVIVPITGKCIKIDHVEDEFFSSKSMGDGFAIVPTDNQVVAPVDGEIIFIADTKHAFGLKTENGIEVLVHIGLDTVMLGGKGFTVYYEVGRNVSAGDLIISFDKKYMDN